MTTTVRPKPRERLIAAAEELFYGEGVHVGVDRLCEVAGVSKRSMYQHFGGKDEVIVEMLAVRAAGLAERWAADEAASPREQILAVFDSLQDQAAASDFHGCPFVNVATELKDPGHPASVAALGYKVGLTTRFEELARQGGATDPEALGVQLIMVFDGACAYSVMRGGVPTMARATAEVLLDAQGVTSGQPPSAGDAGSSSGAER